MGERQLSQRHGRGTRWRVRWSIPRLDTPGRSYSVAAPTLTATTPTTVLIFGGANVKTVQLAMEHTTPTVTLNTYVGYWPDAIDQTRNLVDSALGCTRLVPTGAT